MAIVVEHDKRKHDILQKSLDVFIEEGYEDATFQKIADRCGITRTTLYIYFSNKHEIFLGSIKDFLADLEASLNTILADTTLSAEQALRKILTQIIDYCEGNQKLFTVLLSYFMQLKKSGIDIEPKIRRRVVRLRHHMTSVMIRGIQAKEFKEMNIKDMNELMYSLIEASLFRLIVLNQKNIEDIRDTLNFAVDSFLTN